MSKNTLVVVVGPTGVGKTKAAVQLALSFACDIISADSRQVYKQMCIGTAAPSATDLDQVKHHFVQLISPDTPYNAFQFENDVLLKLETLFTQNNVQVMTGGSMMYIDAVCKGIDKMPDVDMAVRTKLKAQYETEGLSNLQAQLKQLDPISYGKVELSNPARLIHALEVCISTGKPYSSFLRHAPKKRNFNIVKIGVNLKRELLYKQINERVERMIEEGLEDEVKQLLPFESFQALQTVGYREMFAYLHGEYDLARAVELIQRNSRHYAKKQLTWFRKDNTTAWFLPHETRKMVDFVKGRI